MKKGTNYIFWDGRDMYGDLMSTGTYFAFIELNDTVYDRIILLILN